MTAHASRPASDRFSFAHHNCLLLNYCNTLRGSFYLLKICHKMLMYYTQPAYLYLGCFIAWLEHFVEVWSHQDPSVSPHEQLVKQTNKH